MRLKSGILAVVVSCVVAVGVLVFAEPPPLPPSTPPRGTVQFSWDYPTNELSTNLTFYIYQSTDLKGWTVLTNAPGTNLTAGAWVQPGAHFFVMTASNFWGESSFSEVVATPPLPRGDSRLGIQRAD